MAAGVFRLRKPATCFAVALSTDFSAIIRLKAQQRSQEKRQERFEAKKADKAAAMSDKLREFQAKESQTMAMFAELAKHHKLGPAKTD